MSIISELVSCIDGSDRYVVKISPSDPRLIKIIDYLLTLEENKRNGYFKLYFPNEVFPQVEHHIPIDNFLLAGTNDESEYFQCKRFTHLSRVTTKTHSDTFVYGNEEHEPDFDTLDKVHKQNQSLIHFLFENSNKKTAFLKTSQETQENNSDRLKRINLYKRELDIPNPVQKQVTFGKKLSVTPSNKEVPQKVFCPCNCTTELPIKCATLTRSQLWSAVRFYELKGNVDLPESVMQQIKKGTWKPIPCKEDDDDDYDDDGIAPQTPDPQTIVASSSVLSSKRHATNEPSNPPRKRTRGASASKSSTVTPTTNLAKREAPKTSVYAFPFKFAHFYYKDEIKMMKSLRNAIGSPYVTLEFILDTLRHRNKFSFHYIVAEQKVELYRSENEKFEMFEKEAFEKRMNAIVKKENGEIPKILGINTWYTYVGGLGNGSPYHSEDYLLNSCNLVLAGAEKIWTFVPPEQRVSAQEKIKNYMIDYGICLESEYECVNHKTMVIDPMLYELLKIEYRLVIQQKQEMIVTLAGAPHAVWNTGKNMAVAINFPGYDYFKLIMDLQKSDELHVIDQCSAKSCWTQINKRDEKANKTMKECAKDIHRNLTALFTRSTKDRDLLALAEEFYEIRENNSIAMRPVQKPESSQIECRINNFVDTTIPLASKAIDEYENKFVMRWVDKEGTSHRQLFDHLDEMRNFYYSKSDSLLTSSILEGDFNLVLKTVHSVDNEKKRAGLFWCTCATKGSEFEIAEESDNQSEKEMTEECKKKLSSRGIFSTEDGLKRHIRNMNNCHRYVCLVCQTHDNEWSTSLWETLAIHVRGHFATKMHCPACRSKYTCLKRLSSHLRDSKTCKDTIGNYSSVKRTLYGLQRKIKNETDEEDI